MNIDELSELIDLPIKTMKQHPEWWNFAIQRCNNTIAFAERYFLSKNKGSNSDSRISQ